MEQLTNTYCPQSLLSLLGHRSGETLLQENYRRHVKASMFVDRLHQLDVSTICKCVAHPVPLCCVLCVVIVCCDCMRVCNCVCAVVLLCVVVPVRVCVVFFSVWRQSDGVGEVFASATLPAVA